MSWCSIAWRFVVCNITRFCIGSQYMVYLLFLLFKSQPWKNSRISSGQRSPKEAPEGDFQLPGQSVYPDLRSLTPPSLSFLFVTETFGLQITYKNRLYLWDVSFKVNIAIHTNFQRRFVASFDNMALTLPFTSILLLLSFLIHICKGYELVASLDYGTFRGSYSSQYNITYFRKIPFAAPPITNGTYNSDQSFDYCPQRTVGVIILEMPPLTNFTR
jgi:hypothetical protein